MNSIIQGSVWGSLPALHYISICSHPPLNLQNKKRNPLVLFPLLMLITEMVLREITLMVNLYLFSFSVQQQYGI